MVQGLLETPDDLQTHIRTVAAAIIMAIVYGHNVLSMDDKYVSIAEKAVKAASEALLPGVSLVNTIPVLRYIPPWFPGVKFHKLAAEVRELRYQMVNSGFEFVRKNMQDGTGEPSLLQDLLETNDANGGSVEDEDVLKSTVSSLTTFFCAMVISPDVQRKAQHEIDTVVGNDRLPEPGDRPSLPYVEAIYREVMRWRPDDVYNGYLIPKGSAVFANIWAMTHNEHIYKNPDKFEPERYFDSRGNLNNDDTILTFGFGRRVCVGRHLADSTVWLMIVSALATVSIAKAKDSQGNDIEIDGDYTDGLIVSVL
ncbi:cytochrome P450 [Infundibulicybe gibba]|nr:cytochrome P450 [Infundibulicybe gibba]